MQINESIPNFIIEELNKIKNIKKNNWCFGFSFKSENDDTRDLFQLSFLKLLKKINLKLCSQMNMFKIKEM